jgi:hypothetical protein
MSKSNVKETVMDAYRSGTIVQTSYMTALIQAYSILKLLRDDYGCGDSRTSCGCKDRMPTSRIL